MPRYVLEVQRPDGARHLYPLGEHERPVDASELIAAARAAQGVPADDVRDVDAWQLTMHTLSGAEELTDALLERCTLHELEEVTR